jgi:ribulose-phosphate 3-epimerase
MSPIPIVPAIIPKSEAEVVAFTKALTFSRELHLDVVDGVFVPTVSWPYDPQGEEIAVKPHTDKFTLEVDLMVADPISAARRWVKAGADMLVFHIETVDAASFIDFFTHTRKVSIGVSFHGDTPVEALLPYLPYADYVQVMGIHTIGSQGQPFSESTFEKISWVRREVPQLPISVDGSVNKDSIGRLVKAGVDRLIVGSAIVKQENPSAAYTELCAVVNEM